MPPPKKNNTQQHLNKLLSKTLNLELIYFTLLGIKHFSREEIKQEQLQDNILLRRCNFERFSTSEWTEDGKKKEAKIGEQEEKRDESHVLMGIEEHEQSAKKVTK